MIDPKLRVFLIDRRAGLLAIRATIGRFLGAEVKKRAREKDYAFLNVLGRSEWNSYRLTPRSVFRRTEYGRSVGSTNEY